MTGSEKTEFKNIVYKYAGEDYNNNQQIMLLQSPNSKKNIEVFVAGCKSLPMV